MPSTKHITSDMVTFTIKLPRELKNKLHAYSAKKMINSATQVRVWINDLLNGREVKIDDEDRPN